MTPVRWFGLLLGCAGFLLPQFLQLEGLSPAGHRMLGIFFLAIAFWLTEAVPMFATAVLIIFLEVLLLSNRTILPLPVTEAAGAFQAVPYERFFASLADPIIILFMGGFCLASGATKFRLDQNLARVILAPFGTRPALVLMGFMITTCFFSLFMSNTATTATFMALVLPVIATLPAGDRLRTSLALSIPIAANIGGIGTPISTPPNAIAMGALAKMAPDGQSPITFMQWVIGAFPFMIGFLIFAYGLLLVMFRPTVKEVRIGMEGRFDQSFKAWIFYGTFAATVGLWMTEALHGINSNLIGFLPVVVLSCTRVFSVRDLQNLEWHVLWLVAGGIAMGTGIGATGMGEWFVGLFPWEAMGPAMLVAILTLAAVIVGSFISHSATANMLIPIALSLTMSDAIDLSPVTAAVFVAIGSSFAMALPISTPPNAIAYATGEVRVKDMAVTGTLIGAVCWGVFVTLGPWVWRVLGILP